MSISQKKTTSNVPGNTPKMATNNKSKNSPQKGGTGNFYGNGQNNGGGLLNAKHFHNFPHQHDNNNNNNNNNNHMTNLNDNLLMKKLFEAVQKQKNHEKEKNETSSSSNKNSVNNQKRTKKTSIPIVNNYSNNNNNNLIASESYAGAAFDRAPAAASFPIPSFIKKEAGGNEFEDNFSSSCPLPNFDKNIDKARDRVRTSLTVGEVEKEEYFKTKSKFKSLSVSELFRSENNLESLSLSYSDITETTDNYTEKVTRKKIVFGSYTKDENESTVKNINNINSKINGTTKNKDKKHLDTLTKDLRNFLNIN